MSVGQPQIELDDSYFYFQYCVEMDKLRAPCAHFADFSL